MPSRKAFTSPFPGMLVKLSRCSALKEVLCVSEVLIWCACRLPQEAPGRVEGCMYLLPVARPVTLALGSSPSLFIAPEPGMNHLLAKDARKSGCPLEKVTMGAISTRREMQKR